MISRDRCMRACGLSRSEFEAIGDGGDDLNTADAVLRSYGPDIGVIERRNLLLYHLRAALEFGLRDHARRLFLALREFLELHPELIMANGRSLAPMRVMIGVAG
jgi:hypothetical protein